jgi:hypothetical protein
MVVFFILTVSAFSLPPLVPLYEFRQITRLLGHSYELVLQKITGRRAL